MSTETDSQTNVEIESNDSVPDSKPTAESSSGIFTDEELREGLKATSKKVSSNKDVVAENNKERQEIKNDINRFNDDVRQRVLKEDLTPQLIENEKQKRSLKEKLMGYIKNMIIAQIILTSIPLILMTFALFLNSSYFNSLEAEMVSTFVSFMKFYITSIIAEFIAMLFFIVKYVFDTSIAELVKDYKKDD